MFSFIINRLFVLQIVQGPAHASEFDLKYTKTREIKATRGNIYDRNGKLLASNTLSYSITIEDNSKVETNDQRNEVILNMINIIEQNGDTLDTPYYIKQNDKGQLEFTTTNSKDLTRFKKNAYAYMLDKNKQLSPEQQKATAQEVYDFLKNGTGDSYTHMFGISNNYSVKDTLKIMSVRYALLCNYPKYLPITVASRVSDTTVAAIKEASASLPGVEVQ
ncbi:MAG TPA: peptidase, partial [Mobilitalea sp.]|nr:peptidase [Mobilitalea sp.]